MVATKRLLSPEAEHSAIITQHLAGMNSSHRRNIPAKCRVPVAGLPFRLTACQLLYLGLFRAARIIASLKRIFRFPLFTRGTFGFLAVFLAEFRCVCHECFPGSSKFGNCAIE